MLSKVLCHQGLFKQVWLEWFMLNRLHSYHHSFRVHSYVPSLQQLVLVMTILQCLCNMNVPGRLLKVVCHQSIFKQVWYNQRDSKGVQNTYTFAIARHSNPFRSELSYNVRLQEVVCLKGIFKQVWYNQSDSRGVQNTHVLMITKHSNTFQLELSYKVYVVLMFQKDYIKSFVTKINSDRCNMIMMIQEKFGTLSFS